MEAKLSTGINTVLCFPNLKTKTIPFKKIFIQRDQKIKSIKNIIKRDCFVVIYSGTILNNEKKFSFYGIQDNDALMVFLQNSEIQTEYWLKVTQNHDIFVKNMKLAMNPKIKTEFHRIRDIKIFKNEGRKKGLLMESKRYFYQQNCSSNQSQANNVETIIYDPIDGPSTDPLPVLIY